FLDHRRCSSMVSCGVCGKVNKKDARRDTFGKCVCEEREWVKTLASLCKETVAMKEEEETEKREKREKRREQRLKRSEDPSSLSAEPVMTVEKRERLKQEATIKKNKRVAMLISNTQLSMAYLSTHAFSNSMDGGSPSSMEITPDELFLECALGSIFRLEQSTQTGLCSFLFPLSCSSLLRSHCVWPSLCHLQKDTSLTDDQDVEHSTAFRSLSLSLTLSRVILSLIGASSLRLPFTFVSISPSEKECIRMSECLYSVAAVCVWEGLLRSCRSHIFQKEHSRKVGVFKVVMDEMSQRSQAQRFLHLCAAISPLLSVSFPLAFKPAAFFARSVSLLFSSLFHTHMRIYICKGTSGRVNYPLLPLPSTLALFGSLFNSMCLSMCGKHVWGAREEKEIWVGISRAWITCAAGCICGMWSEKQSSDGCSCKLPWIGNNNSKGICNVCGMKMKYRSASALSASNPSDGHGSNSNLGYISVCSYPVMVKGNVSQGSIYGIECGGSGEKWAAWALGGESMFQPIVFSSRGMDLFPSLALLGSLNECCCEKEKGILTEVQSKMRMFRSIIRESLDSLPPRPTTSSKHHHKGDHSFSSEISEESRIIKQLFHLSPASLSSLTYMDLISLVTSPNSIIPPHLHHHFSLLFSPLLSLVHKSSHLARSIPRELEVGNLSSLASLCSKHHHKGDHSFSSEISEESRIIKQLFHLSPASLSSLTYMDLISLVTSPNSIIPPHLHHHFCCEKEKGILTEVQSKMRMFRSIIRESLDSLPPRPTTSSKHHHKGDHSFSSEISEESRIIKQLFHLSPASLSSLTYMDLISLVTSPNSIIPPHLHHHFSLLFSPLLSLVHKSSHLARSIPRELEVGNLSSLASLLSHSSAGSVTSHVFSPSFSSQGEDMGPNSIISHDEMQRVAGICEILGLFVNVSHVIGISDIVKACESEYFVHKFTHESIFRDASSMKGQSEDWIVEWVRRESIRREIQKTVTHDSSAMEQHEEEEEYVPPLPSFIYIPDSSFFSELKNIPIVPSRFLDDSPEASSSVVDTSSLSPLLPSSFLHTESSLGAFFGVVSLHPYLSLGISSEMVLDMCSGKFNPISHHKSSRARMKDMGVQYSPSAIISDILLGLTKYFCSDKGLYAFNIVNSIGSHSHLGIKTSHHHQDMTCCHVCGCHSVKGSTCLCGFDCVKRAIRITDGLKRGIQAMDNGLLDKLR
ncbi:hypothetical protein ADUPG1_000286, partial [Aduncisulcus paluster]